MRHRVKRHCQSGGLLPSYMGSQYQHGGLLPVFVGPRYQHGDGLGDFFRGIWRTVFPIFAPIAAKTAASFISSAGKNIEAGKGFKDSLKGAFHDTKGTALEDVAGGIKSAVSAFSSGSQAGSGHRRRKRRRAKSKGIAKRRKVEGVAGSDSASSGRRIGVRRKRARRLPRRARGIGQKRKRVYKGKRRIRRSSKKINFTNF